MRKAVFSIKILTITLAVFLCTCNKGQTTTADLPSNALLPASPPVAKKAANETIRFLEARVASDPDDFIALNKLAGQYLQQLRETGDIAYLDLASRAANASLGVIPGEKNKGGLGTLIQVQFSSHQFDQARDNALRLGEIDPGKAYVYQLLGDALLELGQYEEAEAAFHQMYELGGIQQITKVAVEQRIARLAILHGNLKEASKHFEAALKIAQAMIEPPPETVAWCQWQLGETAFMAGDYQHAEGFYNDSLKTFPNYFRSIASLGKVLAAKGDLAGAITQYENAVKIIPDPNFVASLGDLYKLAGRDDDAANQYALIEQIGHLSTASGTLYNRQLALFYADHDIKSEDAFANAAKEYEVRKDIYGADALAWAAFKAGKLPEAQSAIKNALKLGTKDARLFYHAGMIAKSAGETGEATRYLELSLKQSPAFDALQSVKAKNALADLKGGK